MHQLICLRCGSERMLTESQTKESGKFVEDKNLKSSTILKYWNIADGEMCTDNKEHRYGWNQDFLRQLTNRITKTKEADQQFVNNSNEIKQTKEKIKELESKIDNLNEINLSHIKEMTTEETEIKNMIGLSWKYIE